MGVTGKPRRRNVPRAWMVETKAMVRVSFDDLGGRLECGRFDTQPEDNIVALSAF